jgi:hypothetical protein
MKFRDVFFALLALAVVSTSLAANGSKGKRVVYEGTASLGDGTSGQCRFLVELEPILFQIESVQNKYRIIRINIKNDGQAPLKLALMKDSIQVRAGSRVTKGSLNPADGEQAWWDGLSPELRKALAYPDQAAVRHGEEENVFAYFPIADLSAPPSEILFKIDSVPGIPIVLKQRGAAAAKAD